MPSALGRFLVTNTSEIGDAERAAKAVTMQELKDLTGQFTGQRIRVSGYYDATDALIEEEFIWDATCAIDDLGVDATHPALCVQPTGHVGNGRWLIARDVRADGIEAGWCGAKGDNVQDDEPYINRALDIATSSNTYWSDSASRFRTDNVWLQTNKQYKVGNTLHVGRGLTFTRITLSGPTPAAAFAAVTSPQIYPTFSDRPVVNVQGARASHVRFISFFGPNRNLHRTRSDTESDWEQYGTFSRNQCFAGITIDAYSGNKPAGDTYPNPTYPAEIGDPADFWNKSFGSVIHVEGCYFDGFTAGVCIKPTQGSDGNGDFVEIISSTFVACKSGVAISGTQTRNNQVKDCKFATTWENLVVGRYGDQTGNKYVMERCTAGDTTYVVNDLAAGYTSQSILSDFYGEGVGVLLQAINSGSTGPYGVIIERAQVTFQSSGSTQHIYGHHVRAYNTNVTFRDCAWSLPTGANDTRPVFHVTTRIGSSGVLPSVVWEGNSTVQYVSNPSHARYDDTESRLNMLLHTSESPTNGKRLMPRANVRVPGTITTGVPSGGTVKQTRVICSGEFPSRQLYTGGISGFSSGAIVGRTFTGNNANWWTWLAVGDIVSFGWNSGATHSHAGITAVLGKVTAKTAGSPYTVTIDLIQPAGDTSVTHSAAIISFLSGTLAAEVIRAPTYDADYYDLQTVRLPIGDQTTPITTGTGKYSWVAPENLTLKRIVATVTTAPVGSTIIIDVNDDGTSVYGGSEKLVIDDGETSSLTSAVNPIDREMTFNAEVAAGSVVTVDFDQVGSGTAGAGVVLQIEYWPSR